MMEPEASSQHCFNSSKSEKEQEVQSVCQTPQPTREWTSSSQTHLLNVCNLSKWHRQPGTECQSTWAYGGFSHSNHSPVIQSLGSCGSHSFAAEKNFHINRVRCWINYVCGIALVYWLLDKITSSACNSIKEDTTQFSWRRNMALP